MSDRQQRLRLTAALAMSAAAHLTVLVLLLRSVPLVDLLAGEVEIPRAKLIRVSLVSRPGGGGGGPLPGTPSAALGPSGRSTPPEPLVAPAPSPPPPPMPTARAKPAAVATPSATTFASLRALAAPAPSPPRPAAPAPSGVAPAPSPSGPGDRVGSLGSPGGGSGNGSGGAGTGDGSGGDGSDGTARPAYGSNPKPPYPLAARRLGVEGVVTLEVLVRPDGSPAEVRVQHSSGSPLLDESALDTVRTRWRFLPARRGNVPVESRVTFPVRFRLSEG